MPLCYWFLRTLPLDAEVLFFSSEVYFVKIRQSALAHFFLKCLQIQRMQSHRAACCAVKTAGKFYKK